MIDLGAVSASRPIYVPQVCYSHRPSEDPLNVREHVQNNDCFLTKATQPKPRHRHLSTRAVKMSKRENVPWFFGHVTPGTRLTSMRNVHNLHRIDDLARIPATPCSDGVVRLVRAAQVDRSQSSLTLRLCMYSTSRMGFPLCCSTLPRDPPSRDSHPCVLRLRCTATFNAKVYMFPMSHCQWKG